MIGLDDREGAVQAAVLIVTNQNGEVLLQLRDDIEGVVHRGCWSLPGGAVGPGEDIETAALRELAEETGIQGGRIRPLFEVTDEERAGGSGHRIRVFHACHPGPSSDLVLGEGQALGFFPVERLPTPMPPFARQAIGAFAAVLDDGKTG